MRENTTEIYNTRAWTYIRCQIPPQEKLNHHPDQYIISTAAEERAQELWQSNLEIKRKQLIDEKEYRASELIISRDHATGQNTLYAVVSDQLETLISSKRYGKLVQDAQGKFNITPIQYHIALACRDKEFRNLFLTDNPWHEELPKVSADNAALEKTCPPPYGQSIVATYTIAPSKNGEVIVISSRKKHAITYPEGLVGIGGELLLAADNQTESLEGYRKSTWSAHTDITTKVPAVFGIVIDHHSLEVHVPYIAYASKWFEKFTGNEQVYTGIPRDKDKLAEFIVHNNHTFPVSSNSWEGKITPGACGSLFGVLRTLYGEKIAQDTFAKIHERDEIAKDDTLPEIPVIEIQDTLERLYEDSFTKEGSHPLVRTYNGPLFLPGVEKIGLISDVHANLEALTVVLEEFQKLEIEVIINLGDTVGYGPNPKECVNLLQKYKVISVLGNHDEALIDPFIRLDFNGSAKQALQITEGLIPNNSQEYQYLKSLPRSVTFVNDEFFFCHGTPSDDPYDLTMEYICTTSRNRERTGKPTDHNHIYAFEWLESQAAKKKIKKYLGFCGHTHLQGAYKPGSVGLNTNYTSLLVEARDENTQSHTVLLDTTTLVNVGSVGQSRGNIKENTNVTTTGLLGGSTAAAYGILSKTSDGKKNTYAIELRATVYDACETIAKLRELGFPENLWTRLLKGK